MSNKRPRSDDDAPKHLVSSIEVIALRDKDGVSWNVPMPGSQNNEGANDDSYDITIVRVHTDTGLSGIGQCEAPSLVIDAIIRNSQGLQKLIAGEDATQVNRLYQKMYNGTGVYGRRGVTICAMGAVECALWDIAGKAAGKPVHELLWRSFPTSCVNPEPLQRVTPYVTIYPSGENMVQLRERLSAAVAKGYKAIKIEEWPGMFANVSLQKDVEVAKVCREVLGDEVELMIDVQNKWRDVHQCLDTIKAIQEYRPYFIEMPLNADQFEGYKKLVEKSPTRIAVGDWGYTTRHDFHELLERCNVDVVQPSMVRSGGLGETMHIAEEAFRHGSLCIPHTWCHVIGTAYAIHCAAITPNMPFFESALAIPDSPIISDLLCPKLEISQDGTMEVPNRPGLGFELNEEVVKKYRVDPY